jgi:putative transposase
MASTHLSIHLHIVFGTKNRTPSIKSEWRERLHGYVGGVIGDLGLVAEAIGGTEDHIHMLIGFRATHRISEMVREIKTSSSRWVHEEIGLKTFGWQEGYGGFSVSPSSVEAVRHYILNQVQHHQRKTFQEEYVGFLKAAGVAFDERFLP